MFDIIDHNLDIFINNLYNKFNINKKDLIKLKNNSFHNMVTIEKKYSIYNDLYDNKYIIPWNNSLCVDNEYLAVKIIN
jgi:hypothetical protein